MPWKEELEMAGTYPYQISICKSSIKSDSLVLGLWKGSTLLSQTNEKLLYFNRALDWEGA